MVRITNCCYYPNLNQSINSENVEQLGEDITNQITVDTSPTILLSTVNPNRKIIKIYTQAYSERSTQLWVHHGIDTNINNFAFPLPLNYLYVVNSQACQPLSLLCSTGTALIKFTVVNKL